MGQLHDFFLPFILAFSSLSGIGLSQNPQQPPQPISTGGSSDLVNLKYHMGPVLAPPIHLYTIWYGNWDKAHQAIIRNFLMSLHPSKTSSPSVSDWWRTVQLYTDQTGANVTGDIHLQGELHDDYSHGKSLTRLTVQSIIKTAIEARPKPLPLDPHRGMYLLLTSGDVEVAEFCRAVCGFHSFTFPAIVGAVVPYAWVGYSGLKCPGMCGYPKEIQKYDYGAGAPSPTSSGDQGKDMGPPNGDVGADGMVSIIGHELAESATNPLDNAWYAGDEPTSPNEIADLCLGVYGPGAGGGYIGMVSKDSQGRGYNVNGVNGKKFLVQWIWDPVRQRCFGPNAQN